MKMKKFLGILLTVCLLASLLSAVAVADGASGDVEIWYYWETEGHQKALSHIIEEFNASQDAITVSAKYVPFADFKKQLSIGAAADVLPDLVILDNPDHAAYAAMGVFADITDKFDVSTYYPGPVNSCSLDGKLYGVPFGSNDLVLFYNEDMLKAAGKEVPTTWDEMETLCRTIKAKYPDALTVFIGPCAAKKDERSRPEVRPYVDYVLTFVELRAMFAARDIEIEKLKGIPMENASPFGRGFARMGGLSEAVVQALKEQGNKDFKLSSIACSGMRECIKALENLSAGESKYNFIEGMACEGGCICGPDSLNHNIAVGKAFMSSHARSSKIKTIADSIKINGVNEKVTPHFINQPGLAGKKEANPMRGQAFQVNQPGLAGTKIATPNVAPVSTSKAVPTPAKSPIKATGDFEQKPATATIKPSNKGIKSAEKKVEKQPEPIRAVATPKVVVEKKDKNASITISTSASSKQEKAPEATKANNSKQTITVAESEPEKKGQE